MTEAEHQQHHPGQHGSRMDSYVDLYAQRAQGMVASEIRALFSVAARPEVVSLAGGMPYVSALPLDEVGAMVGTLIAERGDVALQYGSAQGHPELREQICGVMATEGIEAHPDDIVVTAGAQQALDLVTRILVDPGDVILAEGPSYVGALGTFAAYEASVVHVPMDDEGIIPEALRDTIARVQASGRRVKFLYTVPTFQNPAGVSLSSSRRGELLDVCRSASIPILEDNPYGLLGFDDEPMRALRADDAEGVIYLGSFSKTFASGLRVGWALAPHGVKDKLVLATESAALSNSMFNQLVVERYLSAYPWWEQVKSFQEMYRGRRDAMLGALDTLMPDGCRWTRPAGGFFVWLTLPEGLDSKAMAPRAISSRVAYVPGNGFFSDGEGRQQMRLSYCYPEEERIREGVRRLAGVIEEEMRLRDTFGSARPPEGEGVDAPGPGLA